MTSTQSQPQQAISFLEYMLPNRPWHLAAIAQEGGPPEGRVFPPDPDRHAAVEQWLLAHGDRNVYWTANAVREGFAGNKPTKADIAKIVHIYADCDAPAGANLITFGVDVLARARPLPPPKAVVFSGGGIQVIWGIAGADQATAESIAKAIEGLLPGADNVANIDRLLRLPGTMNYPNAAKRAKGRVTRLAAWQPYPGGHNPPEAFPSAPVSPAVRTRPAQQMPPEPPLPDTEKALQSFATRPCARAALAYVTERAAPPAPGDGGRAFMGSCCYLAATWPELTHDEQVALWFYVYNPRCDGVCDRWTIEELNHKVNQARHSDVADQAKFARETLAGVLADVAPKTGFWSRDLGEPEPIDWLVEPLRIERGAPPVFWAGEKGAAKTYAAQALLAALAAGKEPWCGGPAKKLRVGHIDYEQGERTTKRRYRRLLRGMGVDPKSVQILTASSPDQKLNSPNAEDWLRAACQGLDLVLIDTLRAAVPGVDENASEIGSYIAMLAKVTKETGCAFLVLHHVSRDSGKMRGSTALEGAASVIVLFKKDDYGETQLVWDKVREGSPGAAYRLRVRDLPVNDSLDCAAEPPVTVERTDLAPSGIKGATLPAPKDLDEIETRIVKALQAQPGQWVASRNVLIERMGWGGRDSAEKSKLKAALDQLAGKGRILIKPSSAVPRAQEISLVEQSTEISQSIQALVSLGHGAGADTDRSLHDYSLEQP